MQRIQQEIQRLLLDRKFTEAQKLIKANKNRFPHNPELIRLNGIIELHQGQNLKAEKYFIKALNMNNNYAPAMTNLAYVKQVKGDLSQAKLWLEKSRKINPNSIETLHQLGIVNNLMDDYSTAEHYFNEVLAIYPEHNESRLNLAVLLKNKGEIKLAVDYLHQSLNFNPMQPQVYWVLANLKSYKFKESEKEFVRHLLANELAPHDEVALLFTHAKILEDEKKFGKSFDVLKKANSKKYQLLNQKPFDWSNLLASTKELFTAEYVAQNQNRQQLKKSPILIAGMPRSGSTLIEQILASHSQITGASELNHLSTLSNTKGQLFPSKFKTFQQNDFRDLGRQYLDLCERWFKETEYFTDKMPHNINYAGVLLMANPNARLIHTRRHPMDVCLSVYKQNFEKGYAYSYDLDELVRYYKYQESIADFWKKLFPDRVISIDYEQLIIEPEMETKRLLNFIGLEFEASCLEFYRTKRNIGTASAAQVTQKIYKTAQNYYKQYGEALDELSALLDKQFDTE